MWTRGDSPADELLHVSRSSPLRDRNEEFREFMEAAAPRLGRVAYLLCGDLHRAEELAQTALVRTYEAWPKARAHDPYAYARRVLVNASVDRWRRTRREVLLSPTALPETGTDNAIDTVANRDFLHRALFELNPRQRQVVVLRYLLDLSERETAEELGIAVGTVKSASARGLERLREAINDVPKLQSAPRRGGSHHEE